MAAPEENGTADGDAADSERGEIGLVGGEGREIAARLSRGVCRAFSAAGAACLTEMSLSRSGSRQKRRADVIALAKDGTLSIVEIKSGLPDFRSDSKWPEYHEFCDRFYFAVSTDFPLDSLPEGCGIIVADGFFAEIVRESPLEKLNAARRKAVTLSFARLGAQRLQRLLDPGPASHHAPARE